MVGLFIVGFYWGSLGDRFGRARVLWASIFLYSAANLANAFVSSVEVYAVLRLLAGIGLAGELGAAITLVSESLPVRLRGYGATIVAAVGMAGTVAAGITAEFLDWRICFGIGGVLGLVLLGARIRLRESPIFLERSAGARWGDLRLLFQPRRLWKFARVVAVGVPLWFTSGILITFAPEFGRRLGVSEPVSAGRGVLVCYGFATLGDFLAGLASQRFRSRKKAIGLFLAMTAIASAAFLTSRGWSVGLVYASFAVMGVAGGYWALFVLLGAEQFGSNLRATVATSSPNLVRGAVVGMVAAFRFLEPSLGMLHAAMVVGAGVVAIAYASLASLEETFATDLDFLET
jgi:MFS family permease